MDWQDELISIYLFVCKHYESSLKYQVMRHTNYADLSFSDEEVITIFIYCITDGYKSIKDIHKYACKHLREFFPKLPSYGAYSHRLCNVADIFVPLIMCIQDNKTIDIPEDIQNLMDSLPIVMAKNGRRYKAKVASEIATNNGYCAAKNMYYYGVKLHIVATKRNGKLPLPTLIGLTDAGTHDLKGYEMIQNALNAPTFADKAYQIQNKPILERENFTLYTPVKKNKGQQAIDSADKLLSSAISSVRQTIESLFNWIIEKTGIQTASKVRSYNGLILHVFARLAAACFLIFKPV